MNDFSWTCADGHKVPLNGMTLAHIENSIKMIEKKCKQTQLSPNPYLNPWYCLLKMELSRRVHRSYYIDELYNTRLFQTTVANAFYGTTFPATFTGEVL
jgi:hypothetical protein